VGSIMDESHEVKSKSFIGRLWNAVMVGLVLIGLCAAVLSIAKPELARPETWQALVYGPAVETEQAARDISPAPVLRKAKPVKRDGKLMATYITVDPQPGDARFAGPWTQTAETHNGQLVWDTDDGMKLFYGAVGIWAMGETVNDFEPGWYYEKNGEDPSAIPGVWSNVGLLGTAPAPTLAAYAGPDWPWTYWWDVQIYGPSARIRPCRATISSIPYIIFPWQHEAGTNFAIAFAEIVTADPLDIAFTRKTWDTSPVFYEATTYDPGQTAAAYDAGDGTHIYICSGSYLDGSDDHYFDFAPWDVAATPPTKGTVDTVALPTVHITPLLQQASPDTFRFMCVDGADAKYYEYEAGSGTITLLGTDTLPALPSGYADVACSADAIGRLDISLYERDGTVYFGRHVVNAGGTHRIVENSVAVT